MVRSFDASTTGSSVAERFSSAVTGKVILITGVNKSGLGGTMAEILSRHTPKTLVLASHTPAKVQEVIDELQAKYHEVTYIAVSLDLSSQESCRQAASSLLSNPDIKQIDLLFNNAAVMNVPERELSADGIEIQFATNHVGHFLFTNLIMPKILAAAKVNPKGATRIINVSSLATAFGPIRFSDINFDQPFDALPLAEQPNYDAIAEFWGPLDRKSKYSPGVAYAQSKTANILFALSLTSRLYAKFGILSFALHPGATLTELSRHIDQKLLERLREKMRGRPKTLDQGTATSLVAGLDDSLGPAAEVSATGVYLSDGQVAEAPGWAQNWELGEKLWKSSEKLVGEEFGY